MFWKIYFFILIVLTLPHAGRFLSFRDFIDFIIFLVGMIGFFGFSWKKKVLTKVFWKIFLPVYITWEIFYLYFLPLPQNFLEVYLEGMSRAMFATMSLLPVIPMVIALYLYGFKRTELWKD